MGITFSFKINKAPTDSLPPVEASSALVASDSEVTAMPYKLALGCYVLIMAFYLWMAFRFVELSNGILGQHQLFSEAGVLFVTGFLLWIIVALSRFPLWISLSQGILSTFSLRGKHNIRVSGIVQVKRVILVPGRTRSIQCLKLIDSNGAVVFVQLGSLPRAKRAIFYAQLDPAIRNAKDVGRGVMEIWARWYQIANSVLGRTDG
jgi:hypothetical protein